MRKNNTKQPSEASNNVSVNTDKSDGIIWNCSSGNLFLVYNYSL